MSKLYLGVDIGGTAVKLGVVTKEGQIQKTGSARIDFDGYRTPIIQTVLNYIDTFLSKHGISPQQLQGIGISATGQIDTQKGIVAGTAGHIANWLGTPILEMVREKLHKPAAVANDANCAVIGEHWMGAARGYENVVMITVGTGIGGGIITNNRLLSGSFGIAGELGHIPIAYKGDLCTCQNRGCYEHYASTTALVKAVIQALPHLNLPDVEPDSINGKLIFKLLSTGNPGLSIIISEWIEAVAAGLVGLTHLFNPQLLLIGGGVSCQEELFIAPLREKVLQQIMPGFRKGLTLKAASLGNDAGLLGAVANFILTEEGTDIF